MYMRALSCFTLALVVILIGCQSTSQQDVQTALDAVEAAKTAAAESLPDTSAANGVVGLIDVAVQGYHELVATGSASGEYNQRQKWDGYLRWLELAARTISAVVSILDGSGMDIPAAVTDANRILARYLR